MRIVILTRREPERRFRVLQQLRRVLRRECVLAHRALPSSLSHPARHCAAPWTRQAWFLHPGLPAGAGPAEAIAKRRRRIVRIIGGLASLAIFCLALVVLARTLSKISFADLRSAIA